MTATTVHLPSLVTSPITTTSIRSLRTNQIIHFTSISICRDSSFRRCCIGNDSNRNPSQDFSVLKTDLQFDNGNTWSTMAFYIFSLHIPLSFGGLSVVAKLLHQTVLDPETQAFSLLLIQTVELVAFILLLRFSEKPLDILSFFKTRLLPNERNWLLSSVLGLGFLLALLFLNSLVADKLVGPKDVNNPNLKEILSGGSRSIIWSTLVYCIVTPLLEEMVYRGFLLTSLASRMEWKKAVVWFIVTFDHHLISPLLKSRKRKKKSTPYRSAFGCRIVDDDSFAVVVHTPHQSPPQKPRRRIAYALNDSNIIDDICVQA